MIIYNPGDILLIDIPFTDERGSQKRPALVLIDQKDEDFVLVRITSVKRANQDYDYEIKDLKPTGLNIKSYIRLTKIVTAEKNKVLKNLGHLSQIDKNAINTLLNTLFKL